MDHQTVTFQLATHSLSRIALRLEFLFKTINQACSESHEIIHRFALKNIIELIDIIERPELKSRFIKELIRIEHVSKKTHIISSELADHLAMQIHCLHNVPGRFGGIIHDDDFLKILRQIHYPNTPDCEFNSPHVVLWFDADPKLRQEAITQWAFCLKDLENTVNVYLSLLRETSKFIPIKAHNGFYQHSLSPQIVNHLILLKMDKSIGMIPKIQIGHHNLTIRLYKIASAYEIRDKTVEMEIAFCQI